MKSHVSKNRLNLLANFLDALPPKKFDFAVFGNGELKPEPSCKATGCALGWATTIPQFRRLGLYAEVDKFYTDLTVILKDGEGTLEDFAAAEKLFGISYDESYGLFHPSMSVRVNGKSLRSPSHHATPKKVAAHIRKFIALKWPS